MRAYARIVFLTIFIVVCIPALKSDYKLFTSIAANFFAVRR